MADSRCPGRRRVGIGRRGPINNWTDEVGNGAVMAMDPQTGKAKWKVTQFDVTDGGMLTTALGPAVHRRARRLLPRARRADGQAAVEDQPGRPDRDGADHFQVDGKQYVSVISGHTLVTYALRD